MKIVKMLKSTLQQMLSMFVRQRYYFITYQGVRRDNDESVSIWHDVTNKSPMQYRQHLIDMENTTHERDRKSYYSDFYIINTEKISKRDYKEWQDCF